MLLELTSRHIGLQNVILDYVKEPCFKQLPVDINLHKPGAHEIQLWAYFNKTVNQMQVNLAYRPCDRSTS